MNLKKLIISALSLSQDLNEEAYVVVFTRDEDGNVKSKENFPISHFSIIDNSFVVESDRREQKFESLLCDDDEVSIFHKKQGI